MLDPYCPHFFLKMKRITPKVKSFSLSLITSLFFLCLSCDPVQQKPVKPLSPPSFSESNPLPLHDDADPDVLSSNPEEMSVIQFLNQQKQTQAKKIQLLTAELEETKARLDRVKNEIMIKGTTKEKYFNEKMRQLESQLDESTKQIKEMEEALYQRTTALDEKRRELEELSKTFSHNNNKLHDELEKAKNALTREQKEFDVGRARVNEMEKELNQTNQLLKEMQEELNNTQARLEVETNNSQQLAIALEATRNQYQLALNERQEMEERLRHTLESAHTLTTPLSSEGQLESALATTVGTLKADLQKAIEEKEYYERSLAALKGEVKIIEQQKEELEFLLAEKESNESKGVSDEKEELEEKLAQREEQIKQLEILLNSSSDNLANEGDLSRYEREIYVLKESLIAAQRELLEMTDDYAELTYKMSGSNHEVQELYTKNRELEEQLSSVLKEKEEIRLSFDSFQEKAQGLEGKIAMLEGDAKESFSHKESQYKRLNNTLEHVTASLEREKTKRYQLEEEVAALKAQMKNRAAALPSIALADSKEEELTLQLEMLTLKHKEAEERNIELENKVKAMADWASNLQKEVAAYETSQGNTVTFSHRVNHEGENSPAKLKAKVAYLTTRLAQEKQVAQEATEKLQEARQRLRDLQ